VWPKNGDIRGWEVYERGQLMRRAVAKDPCPTKGSAKTPLPLGQGARCERQLASNFGWRIKGRGRSPAAGPAASARFPQPGSPADG